MEKKSSRNLIWYVILGVIAVVILFGGNGGNTSSSNTNPDSNLVAAELPATGQILSGSEKGSASYKITAPNAENCYVKIVKANGSPQIEFFVRSGATAAVNVPSGGYTVRFAMGDTWYGKTDRFGSNTVYGQDANTVWLNNGDQMSYRLQLTSTGNFTMGRINAEDF